MKILFVHHSGLVGGTGVSLCNNLLFLTKSGFDDRLYTPSNPAAFMEMIKQSLKKINEKC